MGIAESMKDITENIVLSNDMRIKAISDLIADTRNLLNEFSSGRKKMSEEQKENLKNLIHNLSNEVKSLLKEFHSCRKQMGQAQAKNLADFVKNLDKEIKLLLNDFHKERGEKAKELKTKLIHEINDIKDHVKELSNGTKKLMSEYRGDIKKAHNTWQEMSLNLAKSRKGEIPTGVEAGENNPLVEEYIEKKKRQKKRIKAK